MCSLALHPHLVFIFTSSQGGISLFMNIDTTCNQNTVLESETYGIFVTVPARNVYIQDNKIIRSRNSGIKVTRQIDHKSEETGEILTPKTYRAGGIKLTGNQIFDTHFLGIEIDQTHQAIVTHNSISRTDYSGIFIQDSDHIPSKTIALKTLASAMIEKSS